MKQCRVFLQSPNGKLKKIYSIRADDKGKFIQAQIWSSLLCKEYEIPLNSEIHYQCPSNGKDLHLSIKYHDFGPFDDLRITEVENYLYFYPAKDQYQHKQVILKDAQKLPGKSHSFPLTNEVRMRFQLGYLPDSFTTYREKESQHPIYYFPTICTPIIPISDEKITTRPWENGDFTKEPLTENDIVIDESTEPSARVTVCGFLCSPGSFPKKKNSKQESRVISDLIIPDFGVSVIFCHRL